MDVSGHRWPSSLLPKSFATAFDFKKKRYFTVGSGSRLNTAEIDRVVSIRDRKEESGHVYEVLGFAELDVFPVLPKIVQGIVVMDDLELLIVWAEDCLVMIPVSDVLRGGEVCSSGIISTQRHVLLVTRINGNTIRVFFSNGSIDDVRFEKSITLEGAVKYMRTKSRISTFKKGKFRSLCNCLRDGKSLGVKLMSTEGELDDMPTMENIAMPKIYTKDRNYLAMECLYGQDGFMALLPDRIYITAGTGNKRDEWYIEGRFTSIAVLDKNWMLAGDKAGHLYIFYLDIRLRKVCIYGDQWFHSSSGIDFIRRIDDNNLVVVDCSGLVRWFDRQELTEVVGNGHAHSTVVCRPHIRRFSWTTNGVVIVKNDRLSYVQIYEQKDRGVGGTDVLTRNERLIMKQKDIKVKRLISSTMAMRFIVTLAYGGTRLYVRGGLEDRRKAAPIPLEWETLLDIAKPSDAATDGSTPDKLSIVSVTFAFPKYLICQTTHSITVYDICSEKRTTSNISIHSRLEIKLPVDVSELVTDDVEHVWTHVAAGVFTGAVVVTTPPEMCLMMGKPTSTPRRLIVGTSTGLILWAHIPVKPTLDSFPLEIHSASEAANGRAIAAVVSPDDFRIHVITVDARVIYLFAKPDEHFEGGISAVEVRFGRRFGRVLDAAVLDKDIYFVTYKKNILSVTSPSKSGLLMSVRVESRRCYSGIALDTVSRMDTKVVLYFIKNGEPRRVFADLPKSMGVMAGYGGSRITSSLALGPKVHTDDQSTIIVTGNEQGQISLYKMDNSTNCCRPWTDLLKLDGRITAMTSFGEHEPMETNFVVAVGGVRGQIAIFTINSVVPYIRYCEANPDMDDVCELQFLLHPKRHPTLVVILRDSTVITYVVSSKHKIYVLDDEPPSYDFVLTSTTNIRLQNSPIFSARLLPVQLLPNGEDHQFCCNCNHKGEHPLGLIAFFGFACGNWKGCSVTENEDQKTSYNIYRGTKLDCRVLVLRFMSSPISSSLFVAVNGAIDGRLYLLAYCETKKKYVFGHMDRSHESEIIAAQICHFRVGPLFYMFVSSLDQNGLVVIRRMLVTKENIEYDPQPIRKYSTVRKPSQLMVVPEKNCAIVTGEGIQVIIYQHYNIDV